MGVFRLLALLLTLRVAAAVPNTDVWLTRPQLAERLQVAVKTLAMWASRGNGPPYARLVGGFVRYRLSDVEAWEATQFNGDAA